MSDGNRRKWNKGFMARRKQRRRGWEDADLFTGIPPELIWLVHARLLPGAIVSIGEEVFLSTQQDGKMVLAQSREPLMHLTPPAVEAVKAHVGNDTSAAVVGEVVNGPDEYGIVEVKLAHPKGTR